MNGMPVTPRNPFTDLIERVAEVNAGGGRRGMVEAAVSSGAAPTVRSASLGPLPELTDAEKAERDAKLIELGILPKPAEVEQPEVQEQAPVVSIAMNQRQVSKPEVPRLPNFARVQGIDLVRKVVYVDGMEFPVSEQDASDMRIYAMETARNFIINQFNAVFQMLVPATAEAKDGASSVSPLQESEGDASSNTGGQSSVQSVPPLEQMELDFSSGRVTRKTRAKSRGIKKVGRDSN